MTTKKYFILVTLFALFASLVWGCGEDSGSDTTPADSDSDVTDNEPGDMDQEILDESSDDNQETERPPQIFPEGECKDGYTLGQGPYFTLVTDNYGIGRDGLAVDGNESAR